MNDIIDRDARNDLAALIRRYLDEGIKAFDLDDSLDLYRNSDDSVVRFVADTMWCFYDDCDDHLVVASKPQWDYIQRLLLLLESNSTVVNERHRQWSITQVFAGLLFGVCMWIVIRFGIGSHLLVFFVPFGIASIALSRFRRPTQDRGPFDAIVTPFSSIGDLRIAYESARGFRKRQFPRHIASRLIRSHFMSSFWACHMYVVWAILAPVPLLVQCTPVSFNYPIVKPG
ncbi:MAG: hypothetical protein U1A77_22945 [Pirellulales bacterium]